MEEALVTVEELRTKIPFVMDEDEEREADMALESLSDDARYYGKANWVNDNATPRQVKNLILKAAVRHMKNYDGFIQSRAGDEALTWTDRGESSGGAEFTKREVAMLRDLAGNRRSGFHSVGLVAYGETRRRPSPENLVKDEDGFSLPLYVPGTDL